MFSLFAKKEENAQTLFCVSKPLADDYLDEIEDFLLAKGVAIPLLTKNCEKNRQSVTGRLLLYYVLHTHYNLDHPEFAKSSNGKSYLKNVKNIHFNISHSKDRVALLVGTRPVGIDVEFIKERGNFMDMAEKYFKGKECLSIEQAPDPLLRFYQIWTLKESWIKCREKGMVGLPKVPDFSSASFTDDYYSLTLSGLQLTGWVGGNYSFALCRQKHSFPEPDSPVSFLNYESETLLQFIRE